VPSLRARLLLAAPLLVAALVTSGGVAGASTSGPSVSPAPSVTAPGPAGPTGTPDPVARALRLALVGAGVLAVLGLTGLYLTRERA
jgi:hypothetical protein